MKEVFYMAMERKEIDQKYKWDLSAIYKDEAAFSEDFAAAEGLIAEYPNHEKTMCESAESLASALRDMVKLHGKIEKLWAYAFLGFSVDTSDNSAQARVARVRSLAVSADSATWFVSPYLIRLDGDQVSAWLDSSQELKSFRRMIENAQREKPHTLADDSEKLMAKMGDCLDSHGDIRGIFVNSDLQFSKIKGEDGKMDELNEANYITYLMSSDRRVRRVAFKTLYKTYKVFANTFATLYNSYVKEICTLASLRNYDSSITASTFRDEVTPVIYNNLIDSVSDALPVLYDYYDLKREVMGVDKLHLYDVYASIAPASEAKYTYEQAIDEVLQTVSVFGDEYYSTLKAGLLERGWVDVYPTKGKRGGAFSAGCPYTEPYILLNYTDTYGDVSTLAHEAGHSMHSYFSRKYNEPHNSGYTIFVAEVASTVNELLFAHKKLRECKSETEKLYILDKLMETYKATLFRQTMFAEFERDAHASVESGSPLTADSISKLYKGLIDKYFGPRVVCDDEIAYEWARIPHFYSNFYVYKYATCISAASAIVKRIEEEGESYVDQYIEFLKCGGSKSPLESLLVAGIDMTDPKVTLGAISDFKEAISEFRRIYSGREK